MLDIVRDKRKTLKKREINIKNEKKLYNNNIFFYFYFFLQKNLYFVRKHIWKSLVYIVTFYRLYRLVFDSNGLLFLYYIFQRSTFNFEKSNSNCSGKFHAIQITGSNYCEIVFVTSKICT